MTQIATKLRITNLLLLGPDLNERVVVQDECFDIWIVVHGGGEITQFMSIANDTEDMRYIPCDKRFDEIIGGVDCWPKIHVSCLLMVTSAALPSGQSHLRSRSSGK